MPKELKPKSKKKRVLTTVIISLATLTILPLVGLVVTGYEIGWGPFAELRYYNNKCYTLSDTSYEYKRSRITIIGKNGNIAGQLYRVNREEDKQQIVILSHGLATEMWHNINTAASLAKAGISVLMFDYCGGSIHSKSDGKTTDMSIMTEYQDLSDVIDYAKTLDFVDSSRIGAIGYSQGGLVAAITAVKRNDIYKLCLNYPAFSMFEEIRKTYSSIDEVPEAINRNGMITGKAYYGDVLNFEADDIYEYCAQYNKDTLFIHGTADALVDYEVSVKANNLYPNSTLLTIENGTHGFVGEHERISIQAEYDFFKE